MDGKVFSCKFVHVGKSFRRLKYRFWFLQVSSFRKFIAVIFILQSFFKLHRQRDIKTAFSIRTEKRKEKEEKRKVFSSVCVIIYHMKHEPNWDKSVDWIFGIRQSLALMDWVTDLHLFTCHIKRHSCHLTLAIWQMNKALSINGRQPCLRIY